MSQSNAGPSQSVQVRGCPFAPEENATGTGAKCPVGSRAAEFDPFDAPYLKDPVEALRWAREQEPVFYSPKLGYWIVTRYDDVKAVFRDNLLFSPSIALEKLTPAPPEADLILKRYGYAMDRTMVNEDEPQHMERRRLLLESFEPDAIAKHEPAVRKLVRQAIDRFANRGEADLVAEMFWEIPLTVALHFLGVEDDAIVELRQYCVAHTINTWGRPTPEEQLHVAESVGKFWAAANRVLDAMMEKPDGAGWMYFSIRQHLKHPDVVPLSYLRSMMMAILAAAHETTSNAAANAVYTLLSNREAWEEICDNPDLIPNAVEECLRRAGSIIAWRRITTADAVVGGVAIPKGDRILVVMTSANHDERHFENPYTLDLYRDNSAEHLSFGYGAHQCMGKNIARMELCVFLDELSRRFPHLELAPDRSYRTLPNIAFRGPEQLWVKWDPSRNPERHSAQTRSDIAIKIGAPHASEIARTLRVSAIEKLAEGVTRYTLIRSQERALPAWSPGAHIELEVGGYKRKYSLCGSRSSPNHYEIAVLLQSEGRGGSRFICQNLKVGDLVRTRGPKNHFRLEEHHERYELIAGGIGITPILAMADRLKAIGKPYRIHYAGRSLSCMPYLDRIRADHGATTQVYCSSTGSRLNLQEMFPNLEGGTAVYACGPERMLAELSQLATDWPEDSLHVEHFTPSQSLLDPTREAAFEIELRDSKLTLEVRPDRSVLETLEAAGIDIACDCREGLCGSCDVQVLEGEIDHRDRVLSQNERTKQNRMLVCCSRAKGKKLVLSL